MNKNNKPKPPNEWWAANPFIETIAVRDGDIDEFGHVNNVIYLGWMARTAWAHSKNLGFDFAAFEKHDCGLVVVRNAIDYHAPALAGDVIEVGTWISKNDGRLRLRRRFQLRAQNSGQTLASGLSDFVSIKLSSGKACAMPAAYRQGYPIRHEVEAIFG